ncbi:uroporphyrinogen-III synthase [Roseobacteraceae bacterium NS-SX3]
MAGLLMTRPRTAAERFVAGLPASVTGALQVVYAPLMRIEARPGGIGLDGVKGVIFTSANAVEAASSATAQRCSAYCVGTNTTSAAARAGWQAECLGRDAGELAAELLQRRPEAPLLHLRGSHSRGDVAARLSAGGIPSGEQVVYDQVLLPLTAEAQSAIAGQTALIVPLFSPRTAEHFASLCGTAGNLHLIALSTAVAEPLKTLNCKDLRICSAPDAKAMAEAVRDAAGQLTRLESGKPAQ